MDGLKMSQRPKHRLSFFRSPTGTVVLDDSYNSNPEALLSTLKLFVKKAGDNNKIAVLGEMKELGKFTEKFHRDIGKVIAKQNFQAVIGVGGSMRYLIDEINKGNNYTKAVFAKDLGDAIPTIKLYLIKDNYLLIKGSRSIGLDKLVDSLS
jgi:UDP-N-acetylmuramoyl-tripeptide--D-alanyl-D-alanine ligase